MFVAVYTFAKRFTHWPQFFLGLAFSWGALMGWAGQFASLAWPPVLLYVGAIAWTIGYDTIYAHQDKEDDTAVGIGSTALLFRRKHTSLAGFALWHSLVMMVLSFWTAGVNIIAYGGLVAAALMLFRQVWVLDIDDVDQCLMLFKSNNRVGILIFRRSHIAAPAGVSGGNLEHEKSPAAFSAPGFCVLDRSRSVTAMISLPSIFMLMPSDPVERRTRKRGRRSAK